MVSGGENRSPYGMSLNPTTETSSGHDLPTAPDGVDRTQGEAIVGCEDGGGVGVLVEQISRHPVALFLGLTVGKVRDARSDRLSRSVSSKAPSRLTVDETSSGPPTCTMLR